jgi:hypothetical protein
MSTMKKIITAALAAATLAGGMAAASDCSAQPRRYYRYDNDGAAVAAGIAGLALGAALASNSRPSYYYGTRYAYAPSYGYGYSYGYPRPYYSSYARTCVYWRHDRWGRPYRIAGWC